MNETQIIGAIYFITSGAVDLLPESRLFLRALCFRHFRGLPITKVQLRHARRHLNKHTFNLDLVKPIPNHASHMYDSIEIVKTIKHIQPEGLKLPLRKYQQYGVGFLEAYEGVGLIADEMGLGKTAQGLAYLELHPEKRPAWIVCPAFLKQNWRKECEKFLSGGEVHVCQGGYKDGAYMSKNINIINYEILPTWAKAINKTQPKILIGDEVHRIKNNAAARTKAFKKVAKKIPHKILLTGTPILNRPVEIFNAIDLLRPGLFEWWKFINRYCDARKGAFGLEYDGSSNETELNNVLIKEGIMLRRLKSEVLKDLPEKTQNEVYLSITNEKEYDAAEESVVEWLKSKGQIVKAEKAVKAESLVKIEYLKQLAAEGKIKAVIDWVKEFLDGGGSLVLFAVHQSVLNALKKAFPNCSRVDGTTKDKQAQVDRFQTKEANLIIGNQAMGEGWTLIAASCVAFIEYPWSPELKKQWEDRIHRIGQEAESVTVFNLIATDTIDEYMMKLLKKKARVISKIVDGKGGSSESINFLFNALRKKRIKK